MIENLKHICFDLDDTLYEQITPFKEAVLQIHSIPDERIREVYNSFRTRSNEMFFLHQKQKITFEEMYQKRIQLAMKDHGMDITEKEAMAFQTQYQRGQYEISLSDTIRDMLTYMKGKGVKISIITNGPTQHQQRKIDSLGLQEWVDTKDIVISSSVGISKPDKRIFHLVDIHSLYIGDSYENDVVGAKNAGWDVIWLNKYGAVDTEQLADYTVTNDQELFHLVKKLIA